MIQIAYYMFCEICLILALTYFTASVTPFFRDMTQIINITTQHGIWLTPIMWDESTMPAWVKYILRLNPMYYIVTGYRDCFIYGKWITQHSGITVYFWILVIILAIIGSRTFNKMRVHFTDVL